METFLQAYGRRIKLNHAEFLKIAEELKAKGCKVFAPKGQLISFIKVFRDNNHVVFGFADVPYRWYLQKCLKPSKENGSGRTISEIPSIENPFTIEDILNAMSENPNVKDFTEPYYLEQI